MLAHHCGFSKGKKNVPCVAHRSTLTIRGASNSSPKGFLVWGHRDCTTCRPLCPTTEQGTPLLHPRCLLCREGWTQEKAEHIYPRGNQAVQFKAGYIFICFLWDPNFHVGLKHLKFLKTQDSLVTLSLKHFEATLLAHHSHTSTGTKERWALLSPRFIAV